MSEKATPSVREAVAVFHDEDSLRSAVYDLETNGFDRADISLLAPVNAVDEKLQRIFVSVARLEDNADVPTIAYTSPESLGEAKGAIASGLLYVGALAGLIPVVASGGTLAAAIIAVTLGGGVGGAIGAILAGVVGQHHAEYIEDQMERGGLLLTVRTWDKGDEKRALAVLTEHSAEDVHIHGVPDSQMELEAGFARTGSGNTRRKYKDEVYIRLDAGAFYTDGQVFPTETAVQSFLDRRAMIKALFADMKPAGIDLAEALKNPSGAFHLPSDVLESKLSAPLKAELLKRWLYDAKQQQRATWEGMPQGTNGVTVEDVEKALLDLQEPSLHDA